MKFKLNIKLFLSNVIRLLRNILFLDIFTVANQLQALQNNEREMKIRVRKFYQLGLTLEIVYMQKLCLRGKQHSRLPQHPTLLCKKIFRHLLFLA